MNINEGARIIIQNWTHSKRGDVVHLITDETKMAEAKAFEEACQIHGVELKTTILDSHAVQSASVIEEMKDIMSYANVIIGATNFSFITSNAVAYALRRGAKFISLPLSTNDGSSLLEQEFIRMNPYEAQIMSRPIRHRMQGAKSLHVTTSLGTDIYFDISGRKSGFFNGVTSWTGICASASFEVYIPPVENKTHGRVVLDGSMGYIGLVDEPVEIIFEEGRIVSIEDNPSGYKLKKFLESFDDEEMYVAAEFGIGLNRISQCVGRSYIEDESTYSTFHIGMGRNLALGGKHDAKGHFDIVVHDPTIRTEKDLIMKNGKITSIFVRN
ncbi:MAG: aminopeptidase [Erysipelotrichaceae bacterium]|nr:aminopeptidase [Erysipelotrichaceae bacterium]